MISSTLPTLAKCYQGLLVSTMNVSGFTWSSEMQMKTKTNQYYQYYLMNIVLGHHHNHRLMAQVN